MRFRVRSQKIVLFKHKQRFAFVWATCCEIEVQEYGKSEVYYLGESEHDLYLLQELLVRLSCATSTCDIIARGTSYNRCPRVFCELVA